MSTSSPSIPQSPPPRNPARTPRGIRCGPGTGKFLFRIRQAHVADHYAPLITHKAIGAVKLDIVLRTIALDAAFAGGRRQVGMVLPVYSYESLHDLAKTFPEPKDGQRRRDRDTRHLKRKWVGDQLAKLADLGLVRVQPRSDGRRPAITVLSDRGGQPLDDPGNAVDDWRIASPSDRYITIRGGIVASRALARWSAAEVAAYLAAIHAEFYNERGGGRPPVTPGEGSWWRQLRWFNDPAMEPTDRVMLPFSTTMLEEGLRRHVDAGLITKRAIVRNPVNKRRLSQQRVLYTDHFDLLDRNRSQLPADQFAAAVETEASSVPGIEDNGEARYVTLD